VDRRSAMRMQQMMPAQACPSWVCAVTRRRFPDPKQGVAGGKLLPPTVSNHHQCIGENTPLSDKISRHTLKPGDRKELLDLCERIRTRVARETKKRVEMVSCYEAGYDGFWLHRLLEAHDIRNHVIDPASLQVDRRARRTKTDRVDAERLLRSLMAHLRGQPKV
jgi:transposase